MQNSLENSNNLREGDGGHRRSASAKVLSRTTICIRGKVRTTPPSLKTDHSRDKELINCGLKKLVSSFAMAQKTGQKPSKLATNLKTNETKLSADEAKPVVLEATDREATSHIILTDKYTMTDLEEKIRKVDHESTVLNEPQSYKDLQSRDPRLLKKYSMVLPQQKKSPTIPCVDKSASEEDIDDETELLCSINTHILFRYLYYFCTASVLLIGSMYGFTLITFILSKILDKNVFNFYAESPKHETIIRRVMFGIWGSIQQMLIATFRGILRFLTMSTSEAYVQEQEPQKSWFYKS